MHTTEWEDLETGLIVSFTHNGDYSGDVNVEILPWGKQQKEIAIPFKALKKLVANYVQDTKISRLENMSDADEILGLGVK